MLSNTSKSLSSYLKIFLTPLLASASCTAPCIATPRILPTCTRPLTVFSSRMSIGFCFPNFFSISCAILSAQNMGLFYLKNLIFLRAAGGVEGKLVPFLFAQKRGAQRRVIGHLAEHDVGLLGADDDIGMLVVPAYFLHQHRRAHADDVGLGAADNFCALEDALQLADALLYRALHLASLLVLGVFGQIAQRARVLKLLRHLAAAHRAQLLQFAGKLLEFFLRNKFSGHDEQSV